MAPVLSAGASYCLPVSAALQPLSGPLGCSVTLAPGLLLPNDHGGERDNLDTRRILLWPIVNLCNFSALLADTMQGWQGAVTWKMRRSGAGYPLLAAMLFFI
jgi:hypothetical protein